MMAHQLKVNGNLVNLYMQFIFLKKIIKNIDMMANGKIIQSMAKAN